jgi:hypothetical protein
VARCDEAYTAKAGVLLYKESAFAPGYKKLGDHLQKEVIHHHQKRVNYPLSVLP